MSVDSPNRDVAVSRQVREAYPRSLSSRSETGCRGYRFGVDVEDPHRVHLFEEWGSEEDLNVPFATRHFAAFSTLLVEVLADEPTFTRYEAVPVARLGTPS